ncbi:MAG: hypothetical protein K0R51_910 [Cytophagaceae bacterium]|jgi:hypothetical protein|nr:hypothetical protein [Cytophagaceae bacterium]
MQKYLIIILTVVFSCASDRPEETSDTSRDSAVQVTAQKNKREWDRPLNTASIEKKKFFDTLPDYESFQDYLALFKWRTLPVVYDSLYMRSIEGNSSSRLRFSRFFKLQELKEPEELNAFYARDKFDLGNGRVGVTIVTDVAPEVVGPDGELKTVSFIVYDANGEILLEQYVFRFYNVHQLMEYSWGKITKDLSIAKSYYTSEFDSNDWEIIDKGNIEERINLP